MTRAGRLAFATIACALALAAPAAADGPGVGTPAVVTLGDSAISGEAGRWAGNTNGAPGRVDALGPTAYWDTAAGESIPRCHRSKAAQAFIGDGVLGYDLGCSGATTATHGTAPGEDFKPGIDFYSDAQGRMGRLARCRTSPRRATSRRSSACSLSRASRRGRVPVRSTGPSGSRRSGRSRRSSARTSSRNQATRATGASSRCATACASPTTAAPSRGAAASARRTGSRAAASRR